MERSLCGCSLLEMFFGGAFGPPKKMKMARTNLEWVALKVAFETWVFRLGPICEEKPRSQERDLDTHSKSGGCSLFFNRGVMGLWPTEGDEKQLLFSGSASLPLVIPTGAQRSGGTCGSAALPWKCFSTE